MTKYVLNSGGIKNQPARKKLFHREIVKDLSGTPKFLLCNFAQGREYWNVKFRSYCDTVAEDMPEGVTPSFELAMPVDFVEQCRRADVIYTKSYRTTWGTLFTRLILPPAPLALLVVTGLNNLHNLAAKFAYNGKITSLEELQS